MSEKTYEHELSVNFGGVSIGDETASVGIGFDRNGHALDDVDSMLCGKRLDVYAVVGEVGDPAQKRLPGIDAEPRPHIAATADCGKFSAKPKEIGARLKFSLGEIDVTEIAGLAKKSGTLRLNVLGDAEPHGEHEGGDDDGNPFDDAVRPTKGRQRKLKATPATVKSVGDDPAEHDAIEVLANCGLSAKQCEKIRDSELKVKTVGDLIRAIASNEWWHRDIKGIGKANIDKVTDAILEYRKRSPAPDPDAVPTEGGAVEPSGEPCPNVNRLSKVGDGWSVTLAVTAGPGPYRAASAHLWGAGVAANPTPLLSDPEFPTREAALFAASAPVINEWQGGKGPQRKAAVAVKEWVDGLCAAAAVPEDAPV